MIKDILFTCSVEYFNFALTNIAIIQNNDKNLNLTFHVIVATEDLTEQKAKVAKFQDRIPTKIKLYSSKRNKRVNEFFENVVKTVESKNLKMENFVLHTEWQITALRTLASFILEDVDKYLYIDVDTYVNNTLEPFLKINNDKTFSGSITYRLWHFWRYKQLRKLMNLEKLADRKNKLINGGNWIINAKQFRDRNYDKILIETYAEMIQKLQDLGSEYKISLGETDIAFRWRFEDFYIMDDSFNMCLTTSKTRFVTIDKLRIFKGLNRDTDSYIIHFMDALKSGKQWHPNYLNDFTTIAKQEAELWLIFNFMVNKIIA